MIVPMKKVTLLAMESEKNSSLAALRDLGVMQIESKNTAASADTADLKETLLAGKRLLTALEKHFEVRTGKPGPALNGATALAKVEEILEKRTAVLNGIKHFYVPTMCRKMGMKAMIHSHGLTWLLPLKCLILPC